jgi:AraC family transcriptional regulator
MWEFRAHSGARMSLAARHAWPGVTRLIFDAGWELPAGWITASFDRLALCLLRQEIGGRGELSSRVDVPTGVYYGAGHLTLLAATEPITLRAHQLRRAQMVCLLLAPDELAGLDPQQVVSLRAVCSRAMFRDDRMNACARLLSEYEGADERDPYVAGLAGALFAVLLAAISDRVETATNVLTGLPLLALFEYIDTHLDQTMTNDDLARLAGLSSSVFSHAFRDATGMSPQRWQMDARVRLAQRLMLDSPTESLASIGLRAGFSDQSHFSRAFSDIMGISPSAWLHQSR